jgi:hypothetical protein
LIISGLNAFPQEPKKDVGHYLREAAKAHKEKNYPAYLENAKAALNLRPAQPRYLYNVACGYALIGDQRAAVALLGRIANMGLVYPVDTDGDLASLRGTRGFEAIVDKIASNKTLISRSSTAFMLDQKGLITESIAYDTKTHTYYISSVHKRKVVRVDSEGTVKDFSKPVDGLWSAMGIKADSKRRHLWVATAGHPQMIGFEKGEDGRSGIFKYDLDTGRLIKKYLLPNQPNKHWLGDVVITRSGDVFATDSLNPQIYRISKKTDKLELFAEMPPMVSPQGLALTPDEKSMFIADYSMGIFKLDLKTKKITELPAPQIATVGVDGMYFYNGSLIAIQNGTTPHRVVRFKLSKSLDAIENFETLEANNPLFDEPTLGVIVNDTLFYIANSQWGAIDKDGNLSQPEKLAYPLILKLKL